MSTLALGGSEAAATRGGPPAWVRHADLGLLALALAAFLLAGWPLLGYAAAAAAWIVQHMIFVYAHRRALEALRRGDRRLAMGAIGAATLGRVWIVTLSILLVGLLGDRDAGLAAALLSLALVTAHFAALGFSRFLYPEEAAP
ncbi:MAG: hypothetical protein ABI726_10285 [bacterium]